MFIIIGEEKIEFVFYQKTQFFRHICYIILILIWKLINQ